MKKKETEHRVYLQYKVNAICIGSDGCVCIEWVSKQARQAKISTLNLRCTFVCALCTQYNIVKQKENRMKRRIHLYTDTYPCSLYVLFHRLYWYFYKYLSTENYLACVHKDKNSTIPSCHHLSLSLSHSWIASEALFFLFPCFLVTLSFLLYILVSHVTTLRNSKSSHYTI